MSNVYPIVCYADAAGAIEWLGKAFGFETLMAVKGPDGSIGHAELNVGAGIVMLSASRANGPLPIGSLRPGEPATQSVYIAIADPDAHHDRAKAAGAEIIMPLTDMHYGSREYVARDPQGHLWCFGTYVPAVVCAP